MEFLIKNGAYINITEHHGKTPLHCAAESENLKVVKLLIMRGADVNIKDDSGRTAAEICKGSQSEAIKGEIAKAKGTPTVSRKYYVRLPVAVASLGGALSASTTHYCLFPMLQLSYPALQRLSTKFLLAGQGAIAAVVGIPFAIMLFARLPIEHDKALVVSMLIPFAWGASLPLALTVTSTIREKIVAQLVEVAITTIIPAVLVGIAAAFCFNKESERLPG